MQRASANMLVICVGISHHTAPSEERERYAIPEFRMTDALAAIRNIGSVTEAVILQTCGRFEVYACVTEYRLGFAEVKTFLASYLGTRPHDVESSLYIHVGEAAVGQLFRTSAGLETMFIGEADILAQIKHAYAQAQRAGSLGSVLHRLFCEALRAGKIARSETDIGRNSLSIATAAVAAAKTRFCDLRGKSAIVVGAGRMARAVVRRLYDEGVSRLVVCNRTMSRARELVTQIGFAEVVDLPSLGAALESADIVVVSSGASHFVLEVQHVRKAMAHRPERPLFVVDIAVPRNADPDVAGIGNVALVNIDDLAAAVDGTLQVRRKAIPQVEQVVANCVARFTRWYEARRAVPAIAALMRKAEAIRAAEFNRLFERCPDLTERDRMLIAGAGSALVSKMLHSAVSVLCEKTALDKDDARLYRRVLGDLFELNLSGAAS